MTAYWISATWNQQDYWVQRQITQPVSKHDFGPGNGLFDEQTAPLVLDWLRERGATDVHCWPADVPHGTHLEEGEHWFIEEVIGVGAIIVVEAISKPI